MDTCLKWEGFSHLGGIPERASSSTAGEGFVLEEEFCPFLSAVGEGWHSTFPSGSAWTRSRRGPCDGRNPPVCMASAKWLVPSSTLAQLLLWPLLTSMCVRLLLWLGLKLPLVLRPGEYGNVVLAMFPFRGSSRLL